MTNRVVQCPICDKQMPLNHNEFGYEIITNHVRKEHKDHLVTKEKNK